MDDTNRLRELFASNVFNEETMRERLTPGTFKAWKKCLENGTHLDLETANEVAEAMKRWALEKGATHYTHWFQPLNGATAEKHDSFIESDMKGRVIMDFTGKQLVKGEPDASSFPSGGLRATFEARGYTAWDPTAYAFIKEHTLYIPTIFCSYSGQALDKKTPLLRSMERVSHEAVRILRLFGDDQTTRVIPQCGPEQEFFLVDLDLYRQREDLMMTGRTLFGNRPPRGQELEDHYFGQIKPRVLAFMQELDEELWKVGVLSKTRHNEAAPSQHEVALLYTDCNNASDANQLMMEMMKRIANKHGFHCLLHEKPFAGVNGSGKHDNYSLATDSGENLFKPGNTPSKNAQFLLFLAAFIKGVDEYASVLRATVSHAGNELRLGQLEAPPAIMSIFLGDELNGVVRAIIDGTHYKDGGKRTLEIGVDVLPPIPLDNTDRNRTSPMAFTGNKFEFRMPGSSQSVSGPNIAINAMMAKELKEFADRLEKAKDFTKELQKLLKEVFTAHERIIFDGNGYGAAWEKEAKKRGLLNLKSSADALPYYASDEAKELLVDGGIYDEDELNARANIHVQYYNHLKEIEGNTMVRMIRRQILPAVSEYSGDLAERALSKKELGVSSAFEEKTSAEISDLIVELMDACDKLDADLIKIPKDDPVKAMRYINRTIRADMERARNAADTLETITDAGYWPFPVYSRLLFSEG